MNVASTTIAAQLKNHIASNDPVSLSSSRSIIFSASVSGRRFFFAIKKVCTQLLLASLSDIINFVLSKFRYDGETREESLIRGQRVSLFWRDQDVIHAILFEQCRRRRPAAIHLLH